MSKHHQKSNPKRTLDQQFLYRHQKNKNTLGFICYGEILKAPATQVKMMKYDCFLSNRMLSKLDCMLMYPVEAKEVLKKHILVRKSVKELGLSAIAKRIDRPEVFTKEIGNTLAENKHSQIQVVMRTGHVLRGICKAQSRYTLCVGIEDIEVLVFKHGIHEIKILEATE